MIVIFVDFFLSIARNNRASQASAFSASHSAGVREDRVNARLQISIRFTIRIESFCDFYWDNLAANFNLSVRPIHQTNRFATNGQRKHSQDPRLAKPFVIAVSVIGFASLAEKLSMDRMEFAWGMPFLSVRYPAEFDAYDLPASARKFPGRSACA